MPVGPFELSLMSMSPLSQISLLLMMSTSHSPTCSSSAP